MKITDPIQQSRLYLDVINKTALYDAERKNRNYWYSLRKLYYNGSIKPNVGAGHEQIVSQLAAAIVDKHTAYVGTNAPEINFTPKDITDEGEQSAAQLAEDFNNEIFRNCNFEEIFLDANYTGSWAGDGFLITEKKNGLPFHSSIQRPGNIMIGWKTDNNQEIDFWANYYGVSKLAAKEMFGEDLVETDIDDETLDMTQGTRDKNKYFGLNLPFTQDRKDKTRKFVRIIDFHALVDISDDIKAGDEVVIANNKVVAYNKGAAKNLYHFIANKYLDLSTGISDFEHAAQVIEMYDKKLSEQADAVSQSVYHKFITNVRNSAQIQNKLKPGKTQLITLSGEEEKIDILKLNSNSYDSEPLLKNLMNIIRSTTFLQELGQDQVSPNISGKALALVFQGVVQKVTSKRRRWEKLLRQMIIDNFAMMADTKLPGSDKTWRDVVFDENGGFRHNIEIVWPEVLEQDKMATVTKVQAMRQGAEPLVSAYSARQMVGVPDPVQEEKRVRQELETTMKMQQELQGELAQPSTPEGPILTESDNQTEGMPSMEGMPGSAQQSISQQGAAAMANNNRRR